MIEDYTREAGVRELERRIGAVCRVVAAQVAQGKQDRMTVLPETVKKLLGPAEYVRETRLKTNRPGVVTGLAYTPERRRSAVHRSHALFRQGQHYAHRPNRRRNEGVGAGGAEPVRTRPKTTWHQATAFKDTDIHVHVPSGAVAKDGPSAGVAMFTALASLFTARPPVRATVAMTGEVTSRGLVLPIGGLKEKTLAAMRAGIQAGGDSQIERKGSGRFARRSETKTQIRPGGKRR